MWIGLCGTGVHHHLIEGVKRLDCFLVYLLDILHWVLCRLDIDRDGIMTTEEFLNNEIRQNLNILTSTLIPAISRCSTE